MTSGNLSLFPSTLLTFLQRPTARLLCGSWCWSRRRRRWRRLISSSFGVGGVGEFGVAGALAGAGIFSGALVGAGVFSAFLTGDGGFCDCAGGFHGPAGFGASCSLAWVKAGFDLPVPCLGWQERLRAEGAGSEGPDLRQSLIPTPLSVLWLTWRVSGITPHVRISRATFFLW